MTKNARAAVSVTGGLGDLFQRIARDEATSRSELARVTGLAPSTISLRVESLLLAGLVTEGGESDSRGGRRARRLEVNPAAGCIAVIDFGVSHTRIAIADMAGNLLYNEQVDSVIVSESAPEVVRRLWETLADRLDGLDGPGGALRGIAIGVPAPIAQPSGRMVSPAFMPSWNNVSLPALFESHTDVPVVVENDANLFALAELSTNTDIESSNLIAVKLGTRIGSGLISSGRIHRGHNGAAGEASHTTVSGISAIDCSCNVENCLESVASGGAIIARLNASGVAAESTSDVIRLTQAGHPQALDIVRDAGKHIGAALSGFVNFFNPHEVILGGAMASCAPLVASIRSELFHSCLPIVTADLDVRTSTSQTSSAVLGGIRLLLDTIQSPAEIDRLVARSSESNIA